MTVRHRRSPLHQILDRVGGVPSQPEHLPPSQGHGCFVPRHPLVQTMALQSVDVDLARWTPRSIGHEVGQHGAGSTPTGPSSPTPRYRGVAFGQGERVQRCGPGRRLYRADQPDDLVRAGHKRQPIQSFGIELGGRPGKRQPEGMRARRQQLDPGRSHFNTFSLQHGG
jgi:hypothetical protein